MHRHLYYYFLRKSRQQLDPVSLNPAWWSTQLKARVTGFDRVNPNFFINQNNVVLVKNKKNSQ
jgi:hypothetical protein